MMRSASSVPFRLTYQISIQIELVTNMLDRSGDKCHLGHGSMSPKSAPSDGGSASESISPGLLAEAQLT
jgi:hypothetical protein